MRLSVIKGSIDLEIAGRTKSIPVGRHVRMDSRLAADTHAKYPDRTVVTHDSDWNPARKAEIKSMIEAASQPKPKSNKESKS